MSAPTNSPLTAPALIEKIVGGGYCIGCGACAVSPDSPFEIRMNQAGCYEAHFDEDRIGADPEAAGAGWEVCPFTGEGPDEDELAEAQFGHHPQVEKHNKIGFHLSAYAGHVAETGFRERGSSGGMASWLLSELFRKGEIDAVAHVGAVSPEEKGLLFDYKISRSLEEINQRAKSRYYPVEMSKVMARLLEKPGRYALVGLPCFIKAFRLLARQHPVLRERVVVTLAIVCGHLKSKRFADMFAWQCGVPPGQLEAIDFRRSLEEGPASKYGIYVRGRNGDEEIEDCKRNVDYYGSNWGHGFFKYSACDYCDDVFGETADVVVGDAWLPGYVEDSRGANVVVVRDPRIQDLIQAARQEKRVALDAIGPDEAAASQDAGLQHRREGLQYRLFLKDQEKVWRPSKRVSPREDHLTGRQKTVFRLRIKLAELSHRAFDSAIKAGKFKVFTERMREMVQEYQALYAPSFRTRVKRKLDRIRRTLFSRG